MSFIDKLSLKFTYALAFALKQRGNIVTQNVELPENTITSCKFQFAFLHYYPFKKYVEYIFSSGCLSMMSCSILRL